MNVRTETHDDDDDDDNDDNSDDDNSGTLNRSYCSKVASTYPATRWRVSGTN